MIEFRKNRVSCVDESVWTLLWNYICWTLAGKPNGYIKDGKFNESDKRRY